MLSIRAARRYRWRLAGGRLIVNGSTLRFVPNQLERRRADTYWACPAAAVSSLRVRRRVWLLVETAGGATETFRVFGAAAVLPRLEGALHAPTAPG